MLFMGIFFFCLGVLKKYCLVFVYNLDLFCFMEKLEMLKKFCVFDVEKWNEWNFFVKVNLL